MLLASLALVSDPVATTQAPTVDDPIICTRDPVGSEVGTHLRSKKVCMKKSDRDYIEAEQRAKIQQINNNGNDRMRYIPPPAHAPSPR
jgi:hypothetical protein